MAADLTVVVINLARRRDRWRDFTRRWAVTAEAHRPVTRFEAIDADDGHRGCLDSHLAVLAAATGPLLVLEDDAVFAPGFTLDLDPPPGWVVAWLGGQHRVAPEPVTPGWVRPMRLVRSHAYLITDPAALHALARTVPRVDPYFAQLALAQYAQDPFTVGQAAGRSDTGEPTRAADQFWPWPPPPRTGLNRFGLTR